MKKRKNHQPSILSSFNVKRDATTKNENGEILEKLVDCYF